MSTGVIIQGVLRISKNFVKQIHDVIPLDPFLITAILVSRKPKKLQEKNHTNARHLVGRLVGRGMKSDKKQKTGSKSCTTNKNQHILYVDDEYACMQ